MFQALAGDQVVYRMAIQNNVLRATLKNSQNTFRHRCTVQSGKKADGSLSTVTAGRCYFVYTTMSRSKSSASSRPMECKMTTLIIDGTNVSTSL